MKAMARKGLNVHELLYTESNDSCAICGMRRNEWLTIHHIDGEHSNNSYDNQIVLCSNCHVQYHEGKGLTRKHIEDRKRRLIRVTLTQYGLNAMKIADRNGKGVMGLPFLLHHLIGMGFMQQRETQMTYDGIVVTARFVITSNGARLLKKWAL